MPVLAGTSGWQYRDWRGVLYPAGVPQRAWLEHYAGQYPTVENNGAFYRLPARQTFASWRDRTPPGFVMTVKASRYLTHVRRLRDPDGPVRRLLDAAAGLGDRLGPVLLQLPPSLRADPAALAHRRLGYLRLHEGAARPWPRYGRQALASWAGRLAGAWPADAEAFAFFNNDQHGAAVRDASAFTTIAGRGDWRQDHAAGPVPDSG